MSTSEIGEIAAASGEILRAMNKAQFEQARKLVKTPSGRIAVVENGSGPVAVFLHGVVLNGWFWRHQLDGLCDVRRCIALDLLAHGATEIAPTQDVSSNACAEMLRELLDALDVEKIDLVGNDSGGGIAQIFAARHPERLRSLTLTDADAHDNWPPEAFKGFLAMAAAGGLADTFGAMLADKNVYRSPEALGLAYEKASGVSDETIEIYLKPHLASPQRTRDLQRFLAAFDCAQTVAVEGQLKKLDVPTLIAWATDDVFFDVEWSHWLARTIPGTRKRVSVEGGRIYFPEERAVEFNAELRSFWGEIERGR